MTTHKQRLKDSLNIFVTTFFYLMKKLETEVKIINNLYDNWLQSESIETT